MIPKRACKLLLICLTATIMCACSDNTTDTPTGSPDAAAQDAHDSPDQSNETGQKDADSNTDVPNDVGNDANGETGGSDETGGAGGSGGNEADGGTGGYGETGGGGGSGGNDANGGTGGSDETGGAGGSSERWRPAPQTTWQYQLSGKIDTTVNAQVYDIDLFDVDEKVFDELHKAGRKIICYFSAGSFEEWRADAGQFPAVALGKPLDGWPGERWLDTRNEQVRTIMKKRLDVAATRKCDAVEADNVDGFEQDTGFKLTAADQLNYNRFLAEQAHSRGLSIGLKNDLAQVENLVNDFDFAVNEECFEYNECADLAPFIKANKAVFQVEYLPQAQASQICPKAKEQKLSTIIKNLDLDAWITACD